MRFLRLCSSLFSCSEPLKPIDALNGLTSEEATFIRDSYLKAHPDNPNYQCDYSLVRNYGLFNDNYFVCIKSELINSTHYSCPDVYEPYGHYSNWFINGKIIETIITFYCSSSYVLTFCTKEGETYLPQEAYDNGLITDEDVKQLVNQKKYVDLYQKEEKEKLEAYLSEKNR